MTNIQLNVEIEPDESTELYENSYIICDIDGTLLDNGVQPIQKNIDALNLNESEAEVILVTGRLTTARDETVLALDHAGVDYDELIMRQNESQPIEEYKKSVAEQLQTIAPIIVAIDNDPKSRDAYNSLNIFTLTANDNLRAELAKLCNMTSEMITEPSMIEQKCLSNHWAVKTADNNRSFAYTTSEFRAQNDGKTLVGYAAMWDSPSEPMPFTEYVKRGAFSKTLNDGADVRLLIDHEGVPLARTKSGTLVLEEDDRGLRVKAELDPSNPDAARIISAMKRGDLSQMSFAFRTIKDSYNADRSVRELKEVQLFDVSVVTFPAYEETVAELRSRNKSVTIAPTSLLRLRKSQIAVEKLRSR